MGMPRLPIHPHPRPQEALCSWLKRLADPYSLSVPEFADHALGLRGLELTFIDLAAPLALIARLSQRTGVARACMGDDLG